MEVSSASAADEMLCGITNKISGRLGSGSANIGATGGTSAPGGMNSTGKAREEAAADDNGETRDKAGSQWNNLTVLIPEINMDLFGFESYTLLIRRGRQGFGFTVLGSCPVQVGRIDKDSPAEAAGLLIEDCVVRINGQNVSRSAADSVARIVRESEKYIIMEIYRLPVSGLDSPPPAEISSTPWLPHSGFHPPANSNIHPPLHTSTSLSSSAVVSTSNSLRTRSPFNTITNLQGRSDKSVKSDVIATKRDLTPKKRDVITIRRDVAARRDVTPVKNFRVNQASMTSHRTNKSTSEEELGIGRQSREVTPSPEMDSGLERSGSAGDRGSIGSFSSGSERSSGYAGERSNNVQSLKASGRARINLDDCQSICSSQDMVRTGEVEMEVGRREAVEALITCEEEFLLDVQLGVKRYLRPLKNHGLISQQDHAAVFHNIEKIAALSEYHVRQLQCRRVWRKSAERETEASVHNDDDDGGVAKVDRGGAYRRSHKEVEQPASQLTVEALADVYIAKAEEFCEAYEMYCGGVKEGFRILIALKRRPDVDEFLRAVSTDCGSLTLSAFLQSPLQHIRDTVLKMQRLLQYTPVESVDYRKLKSVIQGIRACCHLINESNTQRYGSSLTLASHADTTIVKRSRASAMSSSSSSSLSSESLTTTTFAGSVVSSIDTELLEIQGRLVFPPDIPSFQLATASHHLIYSGPLQLIDTDTEDTPSPSSLASHPAAAVQLLVLLLSDLILLTRPDPDTNALHVVEEPIILRDIVGSNFNCPNACEFLLCVETPMTGLHEAWEPFPVLLRAPSVELKCTWKNILEQRIFSCKSAREQTIVNKNINNIV